MKQIAITELKKMTVKDIIAALPFEVTADGAVIVQVAAPGQSVKAKTQCPNCKLVYETTPPDGKPFFSRHNIRIK